MCARRSGGEAACSSCTGTGGKERGEAPQEGGSSVPVCALGAISVCLYSPPGVGAVSEYREVLLGLLWLQHKNLQDLK